MEVSREAMERYAERRSRRVRELGEPVRQLRLAIHLGAPIHASWRHLSGKLPS